MRERSTVSVLPLNGYDGVRGGPGCAERGWPVASTKPYGLPSIPGVVTAGIEKVGVLS